MGKAVIASRLRTIRYYFSEDALAFFEPHNPSDLANQMLVLYRDPARRHRMAEKALQEFAPIRWSIMKQRYLQLMADATGMGSDPQPKMSTSPKSTAEMVPVDGSAAPK